MNVLLLLFLLFSAAVAVVCGCRWAACRIRRKLVWRARTEPPLHLVWLDEALVGTAGSILLPPMFFLLFCLFAGWLRPRSAPHVMGDAMLRLAFPVAIASVCLWFWGIGRLERFHRSRKERHDHPKALLCYFTAIAWLLLCVPYGLWIVFCWSLVDF